MIRSNRNLFRAFPTRVSPELRYPNKVVRYSAGLHTTPLNLQTRLGFLLLYWAIEYFRLEIAPGV